MDCELNGYEPNNINRDNKKGGGVALYVDRRLNYTILKNMTNIDDEMEIITVEIIPEKEKYVVYIELLVPILKYLRMVWKGYLLRNIIKMCLYVGILI